MRLHSMILTAVLACVGLIGCGDTSTVTTGAHSVEQPQALDSASLSGIYWDPAASGTGFFFENQGSVGVASFYLYEEGTGKAIWYSVAGSFSPNADGTAAFNGTLMRYNGGQPASSTIYTVPTGTAVGDVRIAFAASGSATVSLPARSFTATRFNFGGQPGVGMSDRPEAGIYWNEAQSGRGFIMETQGQTVVMTMFHYNSDGTPTWNSMTGSVASGAVTADFLGLTNGQTLSGPYVAPSAPTSLGKFTVDFSDPCGGYVQLVGSPAYAVKRFAFGGLAKGAECRAKPTQRTLDNSTSNFNQNRLDPTDILKLFQSIGVRGQYVDGRQVVDLDGDGISEIVVAGGVDGTGTTPVRVFRKTGISSYEDATTSFFDGAIPGQVHPRRVITADFNGDGKPDLYFADHGYDHPPFPGAQNVLALSNAATGKLSIKAIAGNPTEFHHCAAAGDVDNNGTVDIFVCGSGFQSTAGNEKGPYLLLNDGNGNMTVSRVGIPDTMRTNGSTASAELVDVDGDGRLDLLIGDRLYNRTLRVEEFRISVYWGNGAGQFSDDLVTRLPGNPAFALAYDLKAEDIDGDGRKDIVVLSTPATLSGIGFYLQVFMPTSNRQFTDESLARTIKNAATWEGNTAGWFPWLHMLDLNGDGKIDIGIGDSSANLTARKLTWINNGTGVFSRP